MRLDKFLKVARLIKRRTVAKELCDQGRVEVNGRLAKAGTQLSVGDELMIRFGQKAVKVRVEQLTPSSSKEEAKALYTILSEERIHIEDDLAT